MDEHSLSFGAHLLMWGFPFALTLMVVVSAARETLRGGGGK